VELLTTLTHGALAGAAAGGGATFGFLKAMSMTKLQAAIIGSVATACVMAPLLMQYQAHAALRVRDEAWQQTSNQLAQLTAENARLSSLLAHNTRPSLAADDEELLKLRGEIAPLRRQLAELTQNRTSQQTPGTMSLAEKEKLWADRAARLKQWADENPSEKIPELKYLTDQAWVASLGGFTFDTPDDLSRAMAIERANAQGHVFDRLGRALRQYVKDNNGQYPADVSQLVPYLSEPIDDDILQHYEIVRSSDLVTNLQGEGEWVLTQKAPVNPDLDGRAAYGLTGA
jgi:hypothetical protein